MMKVNPILDTDAYKLVHPKAIKPGLTKQYVYGEPRVGGKYPFVCVAGLSMVIQDHFMTKITTEMIDEAESECISTFGTNKYFSRELWEKVRDLGYFPMRIMAAPEGLKVPINNVLFTMESTEEWFAPLLNSLETMLMHVWYPTTIATRCMYIKERLIPLVEKSGTMALLPYMVNDFGARGATDWMADYRGGLGHLMHFEGSDNLVASRAIGHYYGYKGRAKSVWATEHSCALAFGPGQGEFDYVNHQLDNANPELICSIVIDTYDSFNFLQNVIGSPEITQKIKDRPGRVVFRPDSGEPKYSIERCLEILAGIFGYGFNNKQYKVLNDNVGLLQGDGMNEDTIIELYQEIINNHWSSDNLVIGSGGGLLQVDANRDTSRWAIKPSYGIINGEEINFQKIVATDKTKASKTGRLILHPTGKDAFMTFSTVDQTPAMFNSYNNILEEVYNNGFVKPIMFEDILKRTNS